jgi:hypothetical protein
MGRAVEFGSKLGSKIRRASRLKNLPRKCDWEDHGKIAKSRGITQGERGLTLGAKLQE